MKDHILAIQALLSPTVSYYVDVPVRPTMPYVLLWGSSGIPPEEQGAAAIGDMTDTLGVTCVAATPLGVLTLRKTVRDALDGSHPAVTGRSVWLSLVDSRPTDIDRTVDTRPAFGVDVYRLTSVPA